MDINIKFTAVVALFGAVQGLFLSFIIFFHNSGNKTANKLLGILIFVFSLRLAEYVSYWTNFFLEVPHLAFTTVTFQFLFGPLLYLYAKSLTEINVNFKKLDLIHFLPFIIHFLSLFPFYIISGQEKIAVLEKMVFTTKPIFTSRFFIVEAAQNMQMLIYTALTLMLIKKFRNNINKGTKYYSDLNVKWLKILSIGLLIYTLLDFGFVTSIWLFGYSYVVEVNSFLIICSALLIYTLGYTGLRKPEFFVKKRGKKQQYSKSGLPEDQSNVYIKKLYEVVENNNYYLKNDLNLQSLAEKIGISPYYLSQIINVKLNQNFFDFINSYRIKEAKRLLNDPKNDNYTILRIAFDVGFNNKTSFNTAFKKFTHLTPSQFRNSRGSDS